MRRLAMVIATGVVVAACGSSSGGTSGGASATPPTAGSSSFDTSLVQPGATDSTAPGGGDAPARKPSGAKIRVFDAYVDPVGTGIDLDAFAQDYALAGDKPIITIPFGTLSPVFDPGVDDGGNFAMSLYAKGETGNGKAVANPGLTPKGGENIVFLVARGDQPLDGRQGAITQGFYEAAATGGSGETPAPGKGRVWVTAVGLDNVMTKKPDWWVGFGKGCADAIDDTDSTHALLSPGTGGAAYDVAPGTYTLGLYPAPDGGDRTCSGKPDVSAQVQVDPGKETVVLVYAVTPDAPKLGVVPLSAP